jgi:hypothetical protein
MGGKCMMQCSRLLCLLGSAWARVDKQLPVDPDVFLGGMPVRTDNSVAPHTAALAQYVVELATDWIQNRAFT